MIELEFGTKYTDTAKNRRRRCRTQTFRPNSTHVRAGWRSWGDLAGGASKPAPYPTELEEALAKTPNISPARAKGLAYCFIFTASACANPGLLGLV